MAAFFIKSFGGVSPKTPPRYLQDSQAQVAINCPVFAGSLVPLPNVGTTVTTLTKGGDPVTIYRWGQDVDEDARYWFSWNYDVDVCRGQVAGDSSEWTFYTGDGYPKATYNDIALTGTDLPYSSIPLGVPNPAKALQPTVPTFNPTTYAAELTLDAVSLANLTSSGLEMSFNNGTSWTAVPLNVSYTPSGGSAIPTLPATNREVYVAGRINAVLSASVTAEVKLNDVIVTTIATGANVTILFRGILASTSSYDTTGTFTYSANFNNLDPFYPGGISGAGVGFGTTYDQPYYVIKNSQFQIVKAGGVKITIKTTNVAGNTVNAVSATTYSMSTWDDLRAFLVNNTVDVNIGGGFFQSALLYQVCGDTIIIIPNAWGTSTLGKPGKIQFIIGELDSDADKYIATVAKDAPGPARLFFTKANYDAYIKGNFYAATINNGTEVKNPISSSLDPNGFNITDCIIKPIAEDNSAYVIETIYALGSSARLVLKAGTYPTTSSNTYFTLSAQGYEDTTSVPDTRVYTYTFVSKVSNFTFESGPASPSTAVDVYKDQPVTLSGFDLPSNYPNYAITAKRIYRTVNGVYLFVAEISATASSYVDELQPDELSEEMTVTGWSPPPTTLQGLINLPNGMMAGFIGRDIYFCDPYHPHAWPESYIQTVDYPVIGLGRMDTTLAVLTKGVPYFIQGSHPESMVVVKSDIQQSCSSKRSIVNINGTVLFASPDGLVMLSSGGSKVLTENMFTRAQWQSINPSSIHAYQHDSKYIAFYSSAGVNGGFVFDLISGQFIFHDIYATAGYNDLVRDQLFLAFSDKTIKKWFDGSSKTYTWRSKIFTMPQIMGFSCAQVEAETYPVTARFYCDNSTTPFHTQTVASRTPFRLPVKVGRDWEVQLEGTPQVFSVGVAQSMEELTGA